MFRAVMNSRVSKSSKIFMRYMRKLATEVPRNTKPTQKPKVTVSTKSPEGIKPPNSSIPPNMSEPVTSQKKSHWGMVMTALIIGTPASIYVALKKSDAFYDYCSDHYPNYVSQIEKLVTLRSKDVKKQIQSSSKDIKQAETTIPDVSIEENQTLKDKETEVIALMDSIVSETAEQNQSAINTVLKEDIKEFSENLHTQESSELSVDNESSSSEIHIENTHDISDSHEEDDHEIVDTDSSLPLEENEIHQEDSEIVDAELATLVMTEANQDTEQINEDQDLSTESTPSSSLDDTLSDHIQDALIDIKGNIETGAAIMEVRKNEIHEDVEELTHEIMEHGDSIENTYAEVADETPKSKWSFYHASTKSGSNMWSLQGKKSNSETHENIDHLVEPTTNSIEPAVPLPSVTERETLHQEEIIEENIDSVPTISNAMNTSDDSVSKEETTSEDNLSDSQDNTKPDINIDTLITDIRERINNDMEIDINNELNTIETEHDAFIDQAVDDKIQKQINSLPNLDAVDTSPNNKELLDLIKELKEELHDSYKNEGVRLYEALQKQKEELMKQAEDTLVEEKKKFEDDLRTQYEEEYEEKVEQLEEEYKDKVYDAQDLYRDAIDEYKENSEKEYEGRLLYVEAETIREWKEKTEQIISEYEDHMSEERHRRIQELNAVNTKLDDLLVSIQDQEQELEKQKTINSISRIILSLNHNMYLAKPLNEDIQQLSLYSETDPVISSFIGIIPTQVAEHGLPPLSAYLSKFEELKEQAHAAGRTPSSNTFGGQLLGHITAKAIKSTDGLDENDILTVLTNMEIALKSGDIETAYTVGQKLQGESKTIMEPWLKDVKLRIDIERGIEFLNFHILGEKLE